MGKAMNVKDEDMILVLSAFTKSGAYVLMKRYRDKMGAEVVEEPMLRDDSMWVFMVTNPFMDHATLVE